MPQARLFGLFWGRWEGAPLSFLLQLLQSLFLLLQIGGHVVEGGLVEAAETLVCTNSAYDKDRTDAR